MATTTLVRRASLMVGLVGTGCLLATGVSGAIAVLEHTTSHKTFSGTGTTTVRVATNADAFATTAPNTWQSVPGSLLGITVPSGSTRLVRGEFTAETFQGGGLLCAARIVSNRRGSSTLTEFYPRSGDEFALDSAAGGDDWEGHAMKRAQQLGAGSWNFRVQIRSVDGGACRVDDWYFDIEAQPVG